MSELERIKLAVKSLISLGIAKNQEEIGTMMGYKSKSSFSQVLNGLVPLPQSFVDKLCALDDRIEKCWLLYEEGHVLKEYKQVINPPLDEVSEPDDDYMKNVGLPLIPVEAMAGYGAGDFQVMEYETEKFIIPTFKGSDYLIGVRGSSMYPKYNSGDIVACKHLPLDTFFQWNKVYVVDTEQGVLIKRICKAQKDDFVTMVSDNKSYDSFDLHRSAIRSLAIVMGVIRLE
jgi:phage repressor protein C with HTH and peptisase S24 domain